MKGRKRHLFIWNFLRPVIGLVMRLWVNYQPKKQDIGGPCLVVSNHCTDLDPILLGLTVRSHCYFIASDHIFRGGLGGKLLMWLEAPIVRLKGVTAGNTALDAIRRMRKGYNVAVFAEGNRSYNGQTGAIVESTAKLAKASGASLVTHRFRGGYLSSPRWAGSKLRRGRLTGEVVNVYPLEQLKTMTPKQIADCIRADIYENAFETQRQWMIPYKGKHLAEHLERAYCLCPRCGALGTLHSKGDEFFCDCGMRTRYDKYGFFRGGELPFDNALDWDKWQAQELKKRMENAGEDCLASDDDIELYSVSEEHGQQLHARGTLKIFADRLELGENIFLFDTITGINLSGPQSIDLSCGEQHWSFASSQVRNLRKYVTLYRAGCEPENLLSV